MPGSDDAAAQVGGFLALFGRIVFCTAAICNRAPHDIHHAVDVRGGVAEVTAAAAGGHKVGCRTGRQSHVSAVLIGFQGIIGESPAFYSMADAAIA